MADLLIYQRRGETAEDLTNENIAKRAVAAVWKCDVVKLSEGKYSCDWALSRDGNLIAWGEFKQRTKEYPDYLLGVHKYNKGLDLAERFNVPFVFFVGIGDKILWCDLRSTEMLRLEMGGSKSGKYDDIEPCVFYAATDFKIVGGKKR